jgi:chemotaxis protein histidine kinase CheA
MRRPATSSALANSFVTLAQEWQSAAMAPITRNVLTPSIDGFRDRLNSLAEDFEAGARSADGQGLRRVALLTEVWECLQSEPGQKEAAAEVAAFCSRAMALLASDEAASSGDASGASARILSESEERWSNYLALVDPTCNLSEMAGDSATSDHEPDSKQDEPPAIDTRTLLGLITGSLDRNENDASARSTQPARRSSGNLEKTSATREPANRPSAPSEVAAATSPVPDQGDKDLAPGFCESDLEIPPLPLSFDLDYEMREAFLADVSELFERIEKLVVGIARHSDQRGAIDELGRCFHTLKGAAGAVGLSELATLVHELEERLGQASGRVSNVLNDLLHNVVSYLEEVIGVLRRGPGATNPRALAAGSADRETIAGPGPDEARARSLASGAEGLIRVSAARFDELTDLAAELIVQGRFWLSQAESITTFVATVRASRNRLLTSIERLYEIGLGRSGRRLRMPGGALVDLPGQLCRLAEQADDLSILAGSAQAAAGFMADRGDALLRQTSQLWDSLQALRVIPIRGLFHRLARAGHDAARVEARQIEVIMVGEGTSADRAILDKAFEPLLHVVRNAVGHGIEPPADRACAGKPTAGRVTLVARREENTLVIAVEDDGKGLDDKAIADKARRLDWLAPDATPSPEQLHAFIFQPGFSTGSQVNAISGRGVGMDVVAREVGKLRGSIELTSQPGRGTRVTVRLPSQLALEPALIVRVAGQGLAIPASQIDSVQPFGPPDAGSGSSSHEEGRAGDPTSSVGPNVQFREQVIPVVFAGEMLGISRGTLPTWPMLMVVRTRSRKIGLVVDAIARTEDLVIRPIGALLFGHPLVSGTSVSVTGELIFVLNPAGLEQWLNFRALSDTAPALVTPAPKPRRPVPEEGGGGTDGAET